jgi:iron(III) transport system substrate-binding protein
LNRLKFESTKPLADIVIAQPPFITTMANLGLFQATGLPQAVAVPPDRCDKQRRWCTVVDNVTSWVYDPGLLVQPPSGYDDLTGPAFEGKIVTSRVDSAVDGIGLALLMSHQLGVAGALDVLHRLEANVQDHFVSTDVMGHAVSLGVALVANGDLAESLNDIQQYGNLALWFPVAGGVRQALSIPFAAAMVRGGHNADNANALLAYMWSAASQQLVGDAYGLPARSDVTAPRDLGPITDRSNAVTAALAGVQVVRIDWQQGVADQTQITPAWLALRHAPDGQLVNGSAPPGGPPTTPASLVP